MVCQMGCNMKRLMLVLLMVGTINGATNYVSTAGDDDTGDGTLESPWRTIRHGLLTMDGGDTLYLRAGTYEEDSIWDYGVNGFLIQNGISDSERTVIASYPGERAIFKPSGSSTPGNTNTMHGISTSYDRDGPKYVTFDGWTIDFSRKTPTLSSIANVKFYSAHFVTFTNMHFLNNTNGSHLQLFANYTNETFSTAGRQGLSNIVTHCLFSNVTRVAIGGVLPSAVHPIYVYPVTGMIIEYSVFRAGHSTALSFGSSGAGTTYHIGTNIITRFNDIDLFLYGIDAAKVVGSQIYNNRVSRIGTGLQPEGLLTSLSAGIRVGGLSNCVYNNSIHTGNRGLTLMRAPTATPDMGRANQNIVVNNIMWDQTEYGMYLESFGGGYPINGTNYFTNNICMNVGAEAPSTWSDQVMTGNLIGTLYNPQFTDPPDDLTFGEDSAALNAGVDLSAVFTTDYFGTERPVGVAWDVGYFEYGTPYEPPDPTPPDWSRFIRSNTLRITP